MPVFLCPRNDSVSLPSFIKFGLGDRMPGPVGEVPAIVSTSGFVNPTYSMAISRIHTIIANQVTGRYSFGPLGPRNIFKAFTPPFWFNRPTVYVALNDMNPEKEDLANELGLSREAGKGIYFGSPRLTEFSRFMSLRPSSTRFRPSAASLDAYIAYVYALKGMCMFSAVSHKSSVSQVNIIYRNLEEQDIEKDTAEILVTSNSGSKSKVSAENLTWLKRSEYQGLSTVTDMKILFQAWDGSKKLTVPTVTTSVTGSGQFFRYFEGMNTPDRDIVSHVFGSLFLNGLADDEESCAKLWPKIRTGLRQLSSLASGMALSHAYTGIEMAKNNGLAITFVVISNVYHGFVLEGDFKTHLYGAVTASIDPMELNGELAAISKHDNALVAIVEQYNKELKEVGSPDITVADISSSRRMANLIYSFGDRFAPLDDKIVKFFSSISDLSFDNSYAKNTVDSISTVLRFVETGNLSILEDYPVYLSRKLLTTDRLTFASQIFFGRMPSLNYADDMHFTVSGTSNDANIIKNAAGVRPLKYIPFKLENIDIAIVQWRKFLESGSMGFKGPRKNKEEFVDTRDVVLRVSGDVEFTTFYDLLRRVVKKTKDERGGKRKRTDADVGGSSRKGKAKAKDDDLTSLY